MPYLPSCHVRDGRDNTIFSNHCQEVNRKIPKTGENTPFGARLIEAFDGASKKEIARKLDVDPSTVTDYTRNEIYPTGKGLIRIWEITKCNLHWLLTGEGEPGGLLDMIDEPERAIVERIAEIYGSDEERVINDLVREALLERGAQALARYVHLQEDQREELDAIHSLLRAAALKRQPKLA
jgi:transcriptional regulator with XRE-family HTH domain